MSAALSTSCATAEARETSSTSANVTKASAPGLAEDSDARRAAALEAAHLDGLDEKVAALASLDTVLAQSFRGAFMRDLGSSSRGMTLPARSRLDEISRVARRVYAVDSLRADLAARLADRPGAAHLEEVLAFLQGPSWQRLSEARAFIRTPVGQKALATFLSEIASRPPDEKKLVRVRELLQASRDVDVMSVLSFVATRAALEAAQGTLPGDLSTGFEMWLDAQSEQSEAFERDIGRTLLLQDYFAFHAVDDRQLDDVLAFWRSDAGRWWAHARVDESRDLVQQRALRVKEELAADRKRRGEEPAVTP